MTTTHEIEIHGETAPGFEPVRQVFADSFTRGEELGAGFCVHLDGRKVVDLWGGFRRRDDRTPYDADTLQMVFSVTKGLSSLCLQMLVERGLLDLGAPVATWWPEFAAAGKEAMPVRWLLSHMAGLPTVDRRLTPEEMLAGDAVAEALAAQAPYWEPGTGYGYHALTFGWLVGELVRRIDGRRIGQFLAQEVAAPLGLDMWIGLPAELVDRVAPVQFPGPDMIELPGVDQHSLMVRAATVNGAVGPINHWVNEPSTFTAEIPAGNAITNARSLSRLYAAIIGTVEGGPRQPLLSSARIKAASRRLTTGPDLVFASGGVPVEIAIGEGFWVRGEPFPFGGPASFGHPGTSGALGFADPEHGIACGYVTNTSLGGAGVDPRSSALVRAAYEAAGIRA